MPRFQRRYALEPDGPERLLISWEGNLFYPQRNIQVYLDGRLLGALPDRAALQAGETLRLPDGRPLEVQMMGSRIHPFLNGQSLADLEHPRRARNQLAILYGLMGLMNLIGTIGYWLNGLAAPLWLRLALLALAGGFAALSWLARRRPAAWVFVIGALLALPDVALIQYGGHSASLGLILWGLLVGGLSLEQARHA